MKLSKLRAQKYGPIKDIELDLDYVGVTCILGRNYDAGPNHTNAAGKSLLLSVLPEVAYESPPGGKDGDKNTGAILSLEFKSDDDKKTISYTKHYGKSKRFVITVNGKDTQARGLDYAREKLRGILGDTEEDFFSSIYVNSGAPHPLLIGSASKREEFLVKLFSLQDVDATRKLLLLQLREVQKASATYKEILSMFRAEKERLKDLPDSEELESSISELQTKSDKYLKLFNAAQSTRDLLAFEQSAKALIKAFKATTSLKTFDADREAANEEYKRLRQQRKAGMQWRDYRNELAAYRKSKAEVDEKLKELNLADASLEDLKAGAEKAEKYKARINELLTKSSLLKSGIKEQESVEQPKYELDTCISKKAVYVHELEHLEELKNGKCPTCGSDVSPRSVEEVKADRDKWRQRELKAREYDTWLKTSEQNEKLSEELQEVKAVLETETARYQKYMAYPAGWNAARDLMDSPTRPDLPKADIDKVMDQLEAASELKSKYEQWDSYRDRLSELFKLTDDDRAKANKASKAQEVLQKINARLSEVSAKSIMRKEVVKTLKTLRTRAIVLKKQAEDEPVLKALVDIYSKKGLKKIRINSKALMLTRQLNRYAKFFFAEDIEFEIKYDKKVEVVWHKKVGKTIITKDVKRLSGAERLLFTLSLVVAQRSLKAKTQRSNLLVLDEPESNLGPGALEAFERVLPVLSSVVPHIVVITPKPNLNIPNARYFTVCKKNGVSTLVKGRV